MEKFFNLAIDWLIINFQSDVFGMVINFAVTIIIILMLNKKTRIWILDRYAEYNCSFYQERLKNIEDILKITLTYTILDNVNTDIDNKYRTVRSTKQIEVAYTAYIELGGNSDVEYKVLKWRLLEINTDED